MNAAETQFRVPRIFATRICVPLFRTIPLLHYGDYGADPETIGLLDRAEMTPTNRIWLAGSMLLNKSEAHATIVDAQLIRPAVHCSRTNAPQSGV